MLTNNYFCTLKYKIMKGILPVYCRTMGYVVLLLSVFVPLFMFMFGMINDSNLLFTKASIKLLIWFSLFMIFLAKVKDENEKISRIRIKAICYAIYLLGIYYIDVLYVLCIALGPGHSKMTQVLDSREEQKYR